MDYVSCDEIIATKGDLIAFRRFSCWCIAYFHFAVFTENAVGKIIPEKIGDRITIGVHSPWLNFPWWEFLKFLTFWKYLVTQPVEETMKTLCKEHGCRVNNHDEFARQKNFIINTPDDVVKRARDFLRQDNFLSYDPMLQNCEHFATKCRYEKAFSLQVTNCISKLFNCCSFMEFLPEDGLKSIAIDVLKNEESKKNIEVDENPVIPSDGCRDSV